MSNNIDWAYRMLFKVHFFLAQCQNLIEIRTLNCRTNSRQPVNNGFNISPGLSCHSYSLLQHITHELIVRKVESLK